MPQFTLSLSLRNYIIYNIYIYYRINNNAIRPNDIKPIKKKTTNATAADEAAASATCGVSRCTLYHKPINFQARTLPKIGYDAYRK